jgi:Na+/proline symporter
MAAAFTALDWGIVALYVMALAAAGWLSTRRQTTADDYFLAGHRVPIWLIAISVLSTNQSAATFLGVPDYGYRGDYTYLTSILGYIVAAFIVARVLMPRFYAAGVTTVYELLRHRYDATAMRAAGAMYLVGRIFASGARLYLAAIAVAMVMFGGIAPGEIFIAALALVAFGLVFTLAGGLRSIIWSDLVQVMLYVGAALTVLYFLWTKIPAPAAEIVAGLATTPDGANKLRLVDLSLDVGASFSLAAILTGVMLLNLGNSGLDQDTTQRLLACRDSKEGSRALYGSVLATIPVVALFLAIGSLLYVFYDRPDLMGAGAAASGSSFAGEKITIFMHFILTEIPPGLRGFVAVGILAAAAVNSGLISMSAVLIQDFYRPWRERRGPRPEAHYVRAGQAGSVLLGGVLLAMAMLCFYWQRYTDTPLLEFALGVMTFAYSGLLGVYFTAVFTSRGSSRSVIAALAAGFVAIALQQSYVVDTLGLPAAMKALAFPWQLCVATAIAALVCMTGRQGAKSG